MDNLVHGQHALDCSYGCLCPHRPTTEVSTWTEPDYCTKVTSFHDRLIWRPRKRRWVSGSWRRRPLVVQALIEAVVTSSSVGTSKQFSSNKLLEITWRTTWRTKCFQSNIEKWWLPISKTVADSETTKRLIANMLCLSNTIRLNFCHASNGAPS